MPLAYAFAVNMASELRQPYFPGFSARASSALLRHDWPGNVRELKNAVERSVYRAENLQQPVNDIAFDPFDSPFELRETIEKESGKARRQRQPANRLLPADLQAVLDETERGLLEQALRKSRFNQKVAADLLGLTYHQLRGRIRKHQLELEKT